MTAQALPANKPLSQAQSARRNGTPDRARALYREVLTRYPANRRARDGLDALDHPDPGARQVTQTNLNAALTDLRAACHRALGAPDKAAALYRTCFATGGNEFAYDQGDLAQYHHLCRKLMDHWISLFSDRIIPLSYEALTAAPKQQARALVIGCGLEWTDACAAPHRAHRPVLTGQRPTGAPPDPCHQQRGVAALCALPDRVGCGVWRVIRPRYRPSDHALRPARYAGYAGSFPRHRRRWSAAGGSSARYPQAPRPRSGCGDRACG